MKIMWVSPHGDGWSIAVKLRDAGNRVVYYCPDQKNKSGAGYLPAVNTASWVSFAERSDLVIVDGNFSSRPTRRSWEPSDGVRDLQQLRHRGVRVIGPTPTTELLENDPRYLRKVLKKCGLAAATSITNGEGAVNVTVSRDPDGRCFLVFRHRHLLGDGNGPELGNLGDVVLPVPANLKIFQSVLGEISGFVDRTGFSSYLNVEVAAGPHDELHVHQVHGRFIYPAIFCQIGHLLGSAYDQPVDVGMAVTLLRLDETASTAANDLQETPGFFGCELMREFDNSTRPIAFGQFVGALVAHGGSWDSVQHQVYNKLSSLVKPGWGFRPGVGSNVFNQLETLRSWGWLDE